MAAFKSPGSRGNTSGIFAKRGPPVDSPRAMALNPVDVGGLGPRSGSQAPASLANQARLVTRVRRRPGWRPAAMSQSVHFRGGRPVGLGDTLESPRLKSLQGRAGALLGKRGWSMMAGQIFSAIISRRTLRPSRTGRLTSRVTTSGRRRRIFVNGVLAVARGIHQAQAHGFSPVGESARALEPNRRQRERR